MPAPTLTPLALRIACEDCGAAVGAECAPECASALEALLALSADAPDWWPEDDPAYDEARPWCCGDYYVAAARLCGCGGA